MSEMTGVVISPSDWKYYLGTPAVPSDLNTVKGYVTARL